MNTILPPILVLVILDYLILQLSLLLYSYRENVESLCGPLWDHIGMDISSICGVRYTDLRGLTSGILVGGIGV